MRGGVLDETAVSTQAAHSPAAHGVQGSAAELARNGAAIASLTVLGADRQVDEHVHENPYLSLHVLGSYRECGEGGSTVVDGPAAAFHPAGSAHHDAIGERGLATVIVEFDPHWVRTRLGEKLDRSRYWIGGATGRAAVGLARLLVSRRPEPRKFAAVESFLIAAANDAREPARPAWLDDLDALTADPATPPRTADLARTLGVSAPWLARAFREGRGEGLSEAFRRRRVETAAQLLEMTRLPLAEIAAEAGFCDQSHMNRAFRLLLGHTPAMVRAGL
jgi:AraC family transcriptional regulator